MPDFVVVAVDAVAKSELADLYGSVGWTAYTRDLDGLESAVARSTYVGVIRDEGRAVGIVRGMSDDVSILYVQDLIVHPDYQGTGLGRALLDNILARFDHVRQKVLLTDDDPRQHRFYAAAGFRDVAQIDGLTALARFD
jgi:ribosomal protein S18 acetylase RimI-like enzyme